MVNPKSLANLEKGRKGKHTRNRGGNGKTWKDLIIEIGQETPPAELGNLGRTWKEVVIRRAYMIAASGNAAILRELMQRSEPQDPLMMTLDVTKLTTDQLERIANGEDPRAVVAQSAGGD